MRLALPSAILFLSPLLVVYLLLRDKSFVENLIANRSALPSILASPATPETVRLRIGVVFSLAIACGALSAMLASASCATCPCSPVLIQAAHYALFLFGLIASGRTGREAVAATLLGFGTGFLAIGVLVQLKTSFVAALLLAPLLCRVRDV